MSSQLSQSIRETVLDERGRECYYCGVSDEQHKNDTGRSLDIHHIIPRRAGGSDDPKNLIPVCKSCHQKLEQTQGDALERIKDRSGAVEDLKRENKELKKKKHEADDQIYNVTEAAKLLTTFDISATVFVVHETNINTSDLLYVGTNVEEAKKAFEQSDNHVTMESATVIVPEWLSGLTDTNVAEIQSTSMILSDALMDMPGGKAFKDDKRDRYSWSISEDDE